MAFYTFLRWYHENQYLLSYHHPTMVTMNPQTDDKLPEPKKTKAAKKARKKRKSEQLWIGPAVKRPGALRAKVLKKFGQKGFDEKGRIKPSSLSQMLKNADAKTRQQIQFALKFKRKIKIGILLR
jgi:hypothetical protein